MFLRFLETLCDKIGNVFPHTCDYLCDKYAPLVDRIEMWIDEEIFGRQQD